MRCSRIAALLVLLLQVHSAKAAIDSASPAVVAMVMPRAEEPGLSPLVRAIRSQLLDIPIEFETVVVEWLGSEPAAQADLARELAGRIGAFAVLWCDLGPPARVSFLVQGSMDGEPVVRQVSGEARGGAMDALALIVRGVVRAALQHATQTRAEPTDSDTAIPPVPETGPGREKTEPWRWLEIELAYAYEPFSADNPDTHAIQLGLAISLHENWCVLAGFRYILSAVTGTSESARIRLRRYPVSLGARLQWRLGEVRLAADLMATLDYVESQTWAPGLKINQDRKDFEFTIQPSIRAGYRIASRFWLFLALGAEVFINRGSYVVVGLEGREQLLDPWPIRPQVVLGFSAEVF